MMERTATHRPRTRAAFPSGLERFTVDQIAEAMVRAGIDGARIYAFRKTGLIPTKNTLSIIGKERMREWDQAIEEYESLQAAGAATKGAGA